MQSTHKKKKARLAGIAFLVILVFVVSTIASIMSDKYIFPWLATRSAFQKYKIFKRGLENTTVINKTEQVTVNENETISSYTGKSVASIVEIVSRPLGTNSSMVDSISSRSGMIVTADGLIATYGGKFFEGNDADYKIFLADGRSYDAKVVIRDAFSNLVLLKINEAQNLPVVEFIAPEDIKTGMKAAAIGRSGFSKELSLRLGITSEWEKALSVSGTLAASEKLQGVLSFSSDVSGFHEESLVGGAAVDFNGNVIGVLGEKSTDGRADLFIVPINHLRYIIDQYIEKGRIERASLGIYYVLLSDETAYVSGSGFNHGALVYSASGQQGLAVIAGSAADKAGIEINDVILSVNGDEINPGQNLAYLISKYKPRDKVDLHIVRNGREMDVDVVLN